MDANYIRGKTNPALPQSRRFSSAGGINYHEGTMATQCKDRFDYQTKDIKTCPSFSPFKNSTNGNTTQKKEISYLDLFCGIGGFRFAVNQAGKDGKISSRCVLSSDIDTDCQKAYLANFGEIPAGDIKAIKSEEIPNHDILLAGFPCQPFSICGDMKGFEDMRGTLFFEIARILKEKQPQAFVLENVKLLAGHNQGKTLERIIQTLRNIGYHNVSYRILNALDFGLPQKRERIFIVGFKEPKPFEWPEGNVPMTPLKDILEKKAPTRFYASEYIRKSRLKQLKPRKETTIWHENKAGHVSAYPYSCALRAGASYNYLLVNGERRLTPREMLRLQGFPDDFQIACNDSQTRKQAGNSVPVPVVAAVIKNVFKAMEWGDARQSKSGNGISKERLTAFK